MNGDGYTNLENYLNSIAGSGSLNPVVQITNPSVNTITDKGATITINAEASDPDGTISKVEFYRNNVKLGEDDTAPYQFIWPDVPEGTYFLVAKAIDNSGTSTDSDAVPVHINQSGDIAPWTAVDIGTPGLPGHSNLNDGVFTVKSSGNISVNPESFQYAYQKLVGDGQLVARIDKITHTTPLAKAGVMIREKLIPGSRMALMGLAVRGDGHVAEFYSRDTEGASVAETPPLPSINPPYYVKIVKFGGTVTGYISQEGTNWMTIRSMPLDANEVYIGLMADAAKENNLIENYNKSLFSQVQLEPIAPVPYRPTGVTVSRGTSDLLVSWSAAERATGYQVKRSLTPGGPYTTIATVSSLEYLDEQVEPGVNYFYVIKAVNGSGESLEYSEERNGALLGTPAEVVLIHDDFEGMNAGEQPAGYDSRPIPGIDQNHILVDEVPASPGGNTSQKLLNLYDDSTSQTRASKAFPAQTGTVIAEVDVMQTAGADYPRVLRLLDTAFGKQYVEIFSGYGAGCPTAYCFYYRNNDISNGKAVPLPANNEFKPNTWYHVKVVADIRMQMADVFINGTSAGTIPFHKDKGWPDAAKLSAIDFLSSAKDKVNEYIDNVRIGVPSMGAPAGVTTAVYGNSAQISWSALPGATSYNLYRSEGDGRFRWLASTQTDLSYTDQGLAYDKTYTYAVAAVNHTIEGDYSAAVSVTPVGPLVLHVDQQSGSLTQSSYTITGSINRMATVKVNGNAVQVSADLKFSSTLNLNHGGNTVRIEAADAAGVQAEPVLLTLFVDSVAPVISLNQHNGSVTAAVYTISGTISEPGKVYINGKETAVDARLGFTQQVNLVKGPNEFMVTAVDALGNKAEPITLIITYDTVKPVVIISNPHGGPGNGKDDQLEAGNYTLTGKISEPGSVTANGIAAQVNADLSYSVVVPLKQGRNRIIVESTDLAGNRSDPVVWEVVATKRGASNGQGPKE